MSRTNLQPDRDIPADDPKRQAERLQRAMTARGLSTAVQLAELAGVPESSARSNLNGTRPLTRRTAKLYAGKLRVDAEWLQFEIGEGPASAAAPATHGVAASIEEEKRNGDLLLRIPAGSPIRDTALKLLQLFGALPPSRREGFLMRLQHPSMAESETPLSDDQIEDIARMVLRMTGIPPRSAKEFDLLGKIFDARRRVTAGGDARQELEAAMGGKVDDPARGSGGAARGRR